MFHWVIGFLSCYLIWRYVWPLHYRPIAKVVLSTVVLLLFSHHALVPIYFGTMASPEIPRLLIMGLGAVFNALLMMASILILRDFLGLLARFFNRSLSTKILHHAAYLHALLVVCLALSVIGVWQAVKIPAVKTIEVSLENLAPEFDGYKLVQLTDLHLSRLMNRTWIDGVVAIANELEPDLIVITGDLIDGTPFMRRHEYPALAQLRAKEGVYAVSGNHEYYAQYQAWMEVFQSLGIVMLQNEHKVLVRGKASLILAGVPDSTSAKYGQLFPELAQALAGKPESQAVILLDHRPANFIHNYEFIDLQLSGHTHGGHMCGFDLLVKQFNEGFVSGFYQLGKAQLYVNNGAGLWPGFPIRLGRPSEITQITLRAAEKERSITDDTL